MARIFSKSIQKSVKVQKRLGALLFVLLFTLFSCLFRHTEVVLPDQTASALIYSSDTHQNLRNVLLQAINRAKESITIIIYAIQDPAVISALKKRADEGVRVTVLYDPVASIDAAWHLGKSIQTIPVRSGKGLMHLKLIAIDGQEAWIGSCNLTRDSLLLHGNLLLGYRSQAVAKVIETRAAFMQRNKTISHESTFVNTPAIITAPEQQFEIYFSPQQGKQAQNKIESLIKSAKKTIKVASYTFTNIPLTNALIEAHARGVDVEVLFDKESSVNTSKKSYLRLKQAHIPSGSRAIPGLMHHKFALIDDETLIMGSANWTKAAFTINDEITCVIHPLNKEQLECMKKTWDAMIDSSTLR